MGKKSRQRQQKKRQQQQLPPPPQTLWEDPASLFPWCSWCGKEDHQWRSCPDGPPADWCGRCEVDGHSWAGCPHNPDQEQLQTPSSAATPPLPTSPPSPPSLFFLFFEFSRLFHWCSWCGKEDHRWRSCPDGPPADWCGHCEADGHSWAGCPHNPDQKQLQTSSSAATPPLPTSPPSPPSQEIWYWLMHPEVDLFHDLPIVINTLWCRDRGRWEKWEEQHHPASFTELALMVINYLAVDMGEAPVIQTKKVELLSREPEREELLS
ncbi:UNVERIFIED_CONTAM: hypothetical protein FKN15_029472 [Acipenser sinensis]